MITLKKYSRLPKLIQSSSLPPFLREEASVGRFLAPFFSLTALLPIGWLVLEHLDFRKAY